jgi:IS5 family transposase
MRIRAKLGRDESSRVMGRMTGDLADLAETAAVQAPAVLRNGRRAVGRALTGRMRGRLRRALGELAVTIERTATLVAQARARLAGQMPDGATRLVSLHDPDARPIRKGRIDRPVEFGYKAQVLDNDDGVVVDYSVERGAAPDGPQLAPAIERIRRRAGRVPRPVTADRGYGQAAVERDLHAAGVRTVAIPRQATTSPARKAVEHGRSFRKLVQMAHRLRRPDQLPQTRLRLGPHPPGRQAQGSDLVRPRGLRPQPGQDRYPGQLTRPSQPPPSTGTRPPHSRPRLFQGEVN